MVHELIGAVSQGPSYSSSQPSLDYLHRRRQELLSQLEERKVISPPPFAASPTLSHPFPSEYPPEVWTVHAVQT